MLREDGAAESAEMAAELAGVKLIAQGDNVLRAHDRRKRGFEPNTIEVWRKASARGGILLDVGAYTGFYSALGVLSGAAHVHAFEANGNVLSRLKDNLSLNRVEDCVTVHHVAVAARGGDVVKVRGKPSLTSAGSIVGNAPIIGEVGTVAIDDLGLSSVDAIKVDVERAEMDVLLGAHRTILRCRPCLFVEILDESPIPELLSAWGYRGEKIDAGMYHFYV